MGGLYERFDFRGKRLDRMTIAALLCAEKTLGYELTIVQGSYNAGGVSASAGTHDGGGAVDLVWADIRRKNRALRKVNFAGWPREALPGVWSRHWHGILIGNQEASAGAKAQVIEYRNGFDGLAGDGRDRWWRPKRIRPFRYKDRAPISWQRLNDIARHPKGAAFTREGARQAELVAHALRGFDMDLGGHRRGRMDKPLIDAIRRFARIRKIDAEAGDPLNRATCWELCLPTREDND